MWYTYIIENKQDKGDKQMKEFIMVYLYLIIALYGSILIGYILYRISKFLGILKTLGLEEAEKKKKRR